VAITSSGKEGNTGRPLRVASVLLLAENEQSEDTRWYNRSADGGESMAKTVSIPEDSIIAMLRGLPEEALVDIFSKVLIESDTSPLTDEESETHRQALKEFERGELVTWRDLK
jgi:hypothetical protein